MKRADIMAEVQRLAAFLEAQGATVQISRPDGSYRLHICAARPGYTISCSGTLRHVLEVLQGVVFGFEMNRDKA